MKLINKCTFILITFTIIGCTNQHQSSNEVKENDELFKKYEDHAYIETICSCNTDVGKETLTENNAESPCDTAYLDDDIYEYHLTLESAIENGEGKINTYLNGYLVDRYSVHILCNKKGETVGYALAFISGEYVLSLN